MPRVKYSGLRCKFVQDASDLRGLDFAMDLLKKHFAIDGRASAISIDAWGILYPPNLACPTVV